jgi:hypothetical protein
MFRRFIRVAMGIAEGINRAYAAEDTPGKRGE